MDNTTCKFITLQTSTYSKMILARLDVVILREAPRTYGNTW